MFKQREVNLEQQRFAGIDFLHVNTKYTISMFNTTSEKWNLHVIDMILNFWQMHRFLHIVSKEKMCITSHLDV